MKAWDFHNPVQLIFGAGEIQRLYEFVNGPALIVTTPGATKRGLTKVVQDLLKGDSLVYDQVQPNPEIDHVEDAQRNLSGKRIETIVAVGGGSSMDFSKALSFALANPDVSLRAHLEAGKPLANFKTLPLVTVPTTSGSGSEVTPFATVWDMSRHKKLSLFGPNLYARTAVIDPELTLSLSWENTLAPGLDAFSQACEAIWNKAATPLTNQLASVAVTKAPTALRALKEDLQNIEARSMMMEASLFAGLAISRTRTGLAHSISYPLTARYELPHGLACSFTVPAIWQKLEAFDPQWVSQTRKQYFATTEGLLSQELVSLFQDLEVPSHVLKYLKAYKNAYALAPEMLTPGRADNMLFPATVETVTEILQATEKLLFAK